LFVHARFRTSVGLLTMLGVSLPALSQPTGATTIETPPRSIVVGFVGGFVRHDNPHHGAVQLAQRIRSKVPKNTYVEVFENRRRKQARDAVLHLLDANHDGTLSQEEKDQARVILFGQSWGGAAVVLLARDLQREGIPVLLTVQVDSVAKLWQDDSVIPANVAEAVNFYQPHGIVHGLQRITAADPSKTEVLGNYRIDYRKTPIDCAHSSWYDRLFTPDHAQSECDPQLWSHIEDLVRQRLSSYIDTTAAANPQP